MSGFQLKRLGMRMEAERGNPLEVEGVLNPAAVRGLAVIFIYFPGSTSRGIIRTSALPEYCLIRPVSYAASSGSALRWSRTTCGDPAAAVARIRALRFRTPSALWDDVHGAIYLLVRTSPLPYQRIYFTQNVREPLPMSYSQLASIVVARLNVPAFIPWERPSIRPNQRLIPAAFTCE